MLPSYALTIAVIGVLLVYCELVWTGRVIPGVTGAILIAIGIYFLCRGPVSVIGPLWIVCAALLFVGEVLARADFFFACAGIAALTIGFCFLVPAPAALPYSLTVPLGIVLGAITAILCVGAKRARRNKRADT